jgi:hypothetical protein
MIQIDIIKSEKEEKEKKKKKKKGNKYETRKLGKRRKRL